MHLYMAPLQGITDAIYRNVFHQFFTGFDRTFAPYITTKPFGAIRQYQFRGVLPKVDEGIPLIPQILSNAAADSLGLARHLQKNGFPEINFNLGCPYVTAVSKKRGAGFLPHTDDIDRFFEEFFAGYTGIVSVKVRSGLYDAKELDALIPVLNRYSFSEIIIHPRTGKQMYTGVADLDVFERCAEQLLAPVVYNGDIRCFHDWEVRAHRFPHITRWMLGRGIISDPFLAERIKYKRLCIPHGEERIAHFMDELFDAFMHKLEGHAHVADKMKGLWKYVGATFKGYKKPLKGLLKAKGKTQYQKAVKHFLADTDWPDEGESPTTSV